MVSDTLSSENNTGVNSNTDNWGGGAEPFKASYGKLMIWYFLLSDAFTFTAFLVAYGSLRFSVPTWPVPDFVFSAFPGGIHHKPLLFVTVMTFVLLASSYTMVRAVQEGKQENKNGVVKWMIFTIIGGLMFLSCQAWEWTTMIGTEHVTIHQNPFGTHTESGVYLMGDGHDIKEGDVFHAGQTYLIPYHDGEYKPLQYKVTEGPEAGIVKEQKMGPKAFGALFFFITGFHGFHVFTGVIFLTIICLNAASGIYVKRRNGYEMVEKIGLYWHFVDLVWVFVFLCFYLL
ncbi:MAG: cytochrome c oxidase subunit 3 [Saprospiraceae bacterium]|nr:MAG: cytochrome c oxidase subunit III [Bacteroidetes bacterium OLB9]MCO6464348.1 cytochrome c oxidase subunit 3 [Saprospiraceae bacterium]MCZ2337241.1 cytochrome c oxidase subunit 3 [Chitinophagales bacterium]